MTRFLFYHFRHEGCKTDDAAPEWVGRVRGRGRRVEVWCTACHQVVHPSVSVYAGGGGHSIFGQILHPEGNISVSIVCVNIALDGFSWFWKLFDLFCVLFLYVIYYIIREGVFTVRIISSYSKNVSVKRLWLGIMITYRAVYIYLLNCIVRIVAYTDKINTQVLNFDCHYQYFCFI